MPKKFHELITGVEQDLSQMPGRGVQVYSEQRIANYLQQAFNLVFDEYAIPGYSTWQTVTLDGVNGLPTTDMLVQDFENFVHIFIHGTERQLRRAPPNRNMNNLTGTGALYVEPRFLATPDDCKRPFYVWPKGATDTLDTYGSVMPPDFVPNDFVYCDDQVIRLGACWLYAEDDATNPGQIAKFKELFNKRLSQLQSAAMNLPVPLDARQQYILTEWAG